MQYKYGDHMSNYALEITSGYVSMPSNGAYNFGTGAFSVLALVKPSATGVIISRTPPPLSSASGGWSLGIEASNVIKFYTFHTSSYYQVTATASNLHDGTWHLIAAVRNSAGAMFIYVDGFLLSTQAGTNSSTPLDVSNTGPLLVGSTTLSAEPNKQYTGGMMNVSLWKPALAQTDIITNMDYSVNGSSTLGCWTFDNSYTDSSPSGNNGSASGSSIGFAPLFMSMPFSPVMQLYSNWCWAAASTGTSHFYDPLSAWTQCLVANACLSLSVCCQVPTPSQCNVYGYLDQALGVTGNFVSYTGGTTSFPNCTAQMNNWRPLGARIAWSGGGAHFVMMSGTTGSGQTVTIRDSIYGSSTLPYTTFVSGYQGSGSWTHSYFTQP